MIKAKDLRIGNYLRHVDAGIIQINATDINVIFRQENTGYCSYSPIMINKEWLLKLGFIENENKRYVNGFEYLFQVSGHIDDIRTQGIDRDGTWFDAIGTYNWQKNGELGVNTLCRGNYVGKGVTLVHNLQNLCYALSGKELEIVSKLNA